MIPFARNEDPRWFRFAVQPEEIVGDWDPGRRCAPDWLRYEVIALDADTGAIKWQKPLGVDQMAYKQATGLAFMVRDMHIDFLRPALLDDELSVTVEVKERRAASILFAQTILKADGSCLVRASVRVACVELERMRPAAIPPDLIPPP